MRAPLAVTLAVAAVGVACATPGHAQSTPPLEDVTGAVGTGWLETFEVNRGKIRMYGMYGAGGNKVIVLPDQNAVVVITTTNYRERDAHVLTDKLFVTQIVPSLVSP
jgi:hypothetical protein